MKILGIDPGYGTVGFGIIELVDSDWEAVDFGAITTDSKSPMPSRLQQIYEDMITLIEEFSPDAMAIEELFFAKNVTTGLDVAQARGIMILAASQNQLPIYEYMPNEVKMSITGYGAADKSQMQNMVQTILQLKKRPTPDDAADALAIALTCAFDVVRL